MMRKIYGLPIELLLVLMFIAVFIITVLILTPDITSGWLGSLFSALGALSKVFGGF